MPVLPDLNSLGQRPIPQPQRRISSVRNAGAVGEAVAEVGEKVSKFGERLDEIRDQDDVRKRDLEHLEGIRIIRQRAQQAQGVDAQAAAATADAEIRQLNEHVLQSARSPQARSELETSITRRAAQERDTIAEHALRESSASMEGTLLAGRDADMNEAEEAWDKPDLVEEHLTSAHSKIASWGRWKGLSSEQIAQEQRAATSKVRLAVAQRMVTAGDYDGALAYADAHRGEIDHEGENSLRTVIRGPMVDMAGEAIVDNLHAMGGAGAPPIPSPASSPHSLATRMIGITAIAESGNHDRNSDGSVRTSSKGAQGSMQVMPGTNGDPGYGVHPARDGSDAERARVGRDYIAALTRHYGNDPAKGWAAYNWGPGNLDAAIGKYGSAWLAHAPVETRRYVQGNLAMLGRGTQAVPGDVPTGRRVDYTAARQEISNQDLPYDVKRSALNALDRRVAAEDRVAQRTETDAARQALEVVERLGDGFTSMEQIPAQVRAQMNPAQRIQLADQAQHNAAPKPIPADGPTALELTLQSIQDPEGFKGKDLRLYQHQVTPGEFASLATAQARMRSEPAGRSPTANLRGEIASTINFYAPDIGWNASTGFDGKKGITPEERQKYLRIYNMMQQHIDQITEGKRAPTDAEMKGAFDRATLSYTQLNSGHQIRQYDIDPRNPGHDPVEVSIPLPTITRIVNAYRNINGREPTRRELQLEYMNHLGEPGFWQ